MLNAHHSQTKLPEAFTPHKIWDINAPQAQAINRKVMAMIAMDNQPFTIVKDRHYPTLAPTGGWTFFLLILAYSAIKSYIHNVQCIYILNVAAYSVKT